MSPGPAKPSGAPSHGGAPGARPSRRGRLFSALSAVIGVLAVVAVAFVSNGSSPGSVAGASDSGVPVPGPASPSAGPAAGRPSTPPPGMGQVALASLPAEAQQVVAKIEDGGAFHYRRDGVTFANRERRLPAEPRGYYREYTVATPGQADRGPRRIVAGRDGELYYTADHYRTFQWVVRP